MPSQTEEVGRGGCWFPIGRRQEGGDNIGILGMSGHKRSFKPTTPSIPHKLAMGRGVGHFGNVHDNFSTGHSAHFYGHKRHIVGYPLIIGTKNVQSLITSSNLVGLEIMTIKPRKPNSSFQEFCKASLHGDYLLCTFHKYIKYFAHKYRFRTLSKLLYGYF